MLTYLFDASAAVEIYLPHTRQNETHVNYILEQKTLHRKAAIFIPNICIAEVFNTFARKRFKPRVPREGINQEDYKKVLEQFRDDVHWGKALYPYDVNRYHIIAADKIILAEQNLASRQDKYDHLSTFDILIIAMACELAYMGQRDETFLVTCDKRMSRVCEMLRSSDLTHLDVPGPVSDTEKQRWQPPTCLYLPEIKRGDIKAVIGQPCLNY
jgi:predicted nucleic acid-binding protein